MLYDGRQYRRNARLGYRKAQDHAFIDVGKRDMYAEGGITTSRGQLILDNYLVVFRVKDAKVVEMDDVTYYDQSTVAPEKCIPICAHTATNVALGVPVIKSSSAGPVINVGRHAGAHVTPGQPFIEQAHYLVQDCKVYQWTSRRLADKEDKAA